MIRKINLIETIRNHVKRPNLRLTVIKNMVVSEIVSALADKKDVKWREGAISGSLIREIDPRMSIKEIKTNHFTFSIKPFDLINFLAPKSQSPLPEQALIQTFIDMSAGKVQLIKDKILKIEFQRNEEAARYFVLEEARISEDARVLQLKRELNGLERNPEFLLHKLRKASDLLQEIIKTLSFYADLESRVNLRFILSSLEQLNSLEKKLKLEEFKKELSESELAVIYTSLGAAYNYASQHSEAIQYFQKVLIFNPKEIGAYLNIGYAYEKMGDFPSALIWYQEALRLEPDDLLIQNRVKRVQLALTKSQKNN